MLLFAMEKITPFVGVIISFGVKGILMHVKLKIIYFRLIRHKGYTMDGNSREKVLFRPQLFMLQNCISRMFQSLYRACFWIP